MLKNALQSQTIYAYILIRISLFFSHKPLIIYDEMNEKGMQIVDRFANNSMLRPFCRRILPDIVDIGAIGKNWVRLTRVKFLRFSFLTKYLSDLKTANGWLFNSSC
jgi:hypothetical protein